MEGTAGCAKVKEELLSEFLTSLAFLTVELASKGFMPSEPVEKCGNCQN